jgi:oligopeptidase B
MQSRKGLLFALSFIALNAFAQQAPQTKKETKIFTEHGNERRDDYYWLSNPNDSNVIRHLHAENAYVNSYLEHTKPLQQKIYDELVGRIEQRYASLPTKQNGYWYSIRYEEGKQYPYYIRKKETMSAPEEILLDVPKMAEHYQVFLVRGTKPSPDNRIFAYATDTSGDRRMLIRFKDLATGNVYPDALTNAAQYMAWARDNKTFFYVVNDHTVRAFKVMRHVLGDDPQNDKTIFTEKDSTFNVGVRTSKSGRFIIISSGSTNSSEVLYIDATKPQSEPVMVQPRQPKLEYTVEHVEGDIFHILNNHNATNFKYSTAPISDPSIKNWKELIPHNSKALLEKVEVLKDYYVAQSRESGLTQIRIYNRKTKKWQQVNFGQAAYVANFYMATDQYDSDSIRYSFASMVTPTTDYLYSLKTGEKKILKQQKPGAYDPSLYSTRRIWITAQDGTKVPVSLAYRKDKFRQDGSNPLLLYSYGSYGYSSDPYFSSSSVSLMDRGFVYAIAHIRGGQELGREWYEGGKVMTKKNTFTDYIDAAQQLVTQKYTSPDRLFGNGGSAGGMLMGAVTNLRPDLFRGIIAEVPWMDVVTDMFNTDLPLTTLEYDEWGDPNKKEHYDYMLSWSPYDNVKKASYPAIFATGGLNDTQVPYFSPAKWVARVREHNTGKNPVLFHVNMGAGHGGESGRFAAQKLTALKYAFVLDQLGWDEKTKTFQFKKAF